MKNFMIVLSVFAVLVFYCMIRALMNKKPISRHITWLLFYDLVSIIGNIIIIVSGQYKPSFIGYLMYLGGTDWLFYFLVKFSMAFCDYQFEKKWWQWGLLLLTIFDTTSVLLNPLFHHVFTLEAVVIEGGEIYYKLVSHAFHYVHLAFSYAVVAVSLAIFIHKMIHVSRLYLEKYLTIFVTFCIVIVWESWYVFSKEPVDHSMLGYSLCGVLMYYFALRYLPFFLTEKMLSAIVSNMSDAILFLDNKGDCVYFNDGAKKLFNLQAGDYSAAKKTVCAIISDSDMDDCESLQVIRTLSVDNAERIYEIEYQKLNDVRNVYAGAFVSIKDRTEEEAEKRREQYLATHDSLTGLYNKEYLLHKMELLLRDNPETEYLILCSDIKEFKLVNDIFGRQAGDSILASVARVVKSYASDNSVYGRIGGDMFALMMRKKDFSQELFERGSAGFVHKEGNEVYPITMHIGIYEVKERDLAPSIMIDRAFLAMEEIKDNVQQRVAWYDDTMRQSLLWAQQVTASFESALKSMQFIPYLQAQVNADGKTEGAEVLSRWLHPEHGLMEPSRFIPILEKSGDIVRLDRYMWEASCGILARWKREGKNLYLSINISPKDFYYIDVYAEISSLVKRYGLDPAMLRLEITESVMMNDLDRKMQIINCFRQDGFIVEIDDFGSGYSSLNLLKNLQVDSIKLDMMFLRQSTDSLRTRTILQHIISMAQSLEMPVITEGVETQDQVDFLKVAGCNLFQGYFFSKPITLESFEQKFCS